MAKINEADRNLHSAPDRDVARLHNEDGIAERIREWLETPEGSMAHHPAWGHNLAPFKHDPTARNLDVQIEMALTRKLPLDVKDVVILGVRVILPDIDLCTIHIRHQFGDYVNQVNL